MNTVLSLFFYSHSTSEDIPDDWELVNDFQETPQTLNSEQLAVEIHPTLYTQQKQVSRSAPRKSKKLHPILAALKDKELKISKKKKLYH